MYSTADDDLIAIHLQQQPAEIFEGGVLPVIAHVASHAENSTELRCLARIACSAMNPAAGANIPSNTIKFHNSPI